VKANWTLGDDKGNRELFHENQLETNNKVSIAQNRRNSHQVRQVGFLQAVRFPPTRKPSERKHRCQRAWLI